MSLKPKPVVPGPKGRFLFGHSQALRQDPISAFTDGVERYGDIVSFDIFGNRIFLLNHPDYAKRVLHTDAKNFTKQTHGVKKLIVFGRGLVRSEGTLWQRQRKLIQPVFHRQSVEKFFDVMLDNANGFVCKLGAVHASASTFNFSSEVTKMTQRIVCQTLFGANISGLERLESALKYYLYEARVRVYRFPNFPLWVPTKPNREFRKARAVLVHFVNTIMRERGDTQPNLLTMLVTATDPETGEGMSETQIQDEIQTFLIAGHDTVANNLIWTIYLLSKHPEVKDKLFQELATVMNGRPLSLEALSELRLTKSIILESLRYYPPVWILPRSPKTDIEIGGYVIPAGSSVYISTYLLHRHPDFWSDPQTFDPERFLGDRRNAVPKFAYLPFGAGPRQCIGREFALMESLIVLATIFKDYDLTSDQKVEPKPGITLRPSPDLMVRVRKLTQ